MESIIALPNIFIPFFGGMLIDYFGVNSSLILYSLIIMIAQTIIVFGGYGNYFMTILLGRFILGIGKK